MPYAAQEGKEETRPCRGSGLIQPQCLKSSCAAGGNLPLFSQRRSDLTPTVTPLLQLSHVAGQSRKSGVR